MVVLQRFIPIVLLLKIYRVEVLTIKLSLLRASISKLPVGIQTVSLTKTRIDVADLVRVFVTGERFEPALGINPEHRIGVTPTRVSVDIALTNLLNILTVTGSAVESLTSAPMM
jgi:hypothetical protein